MKEMKMLNFEKLSLFLDIMNPFTMNEGESVDDMFEECIFF